MLEEHVRLLFNEREIIITLLLVTGIVFNYSKLVKQHKTLLLYALLLLIGMGMISYSKSPNYLLLYFPFTVIIIGYSWQLTERKNTRYQQLAYRFLLLCFALIHLFFALQKIVENIRDFHKPSLVLINRRNAALITAPHAGLSVLSYNNFVFNEIKNFRSIKSLNIYSFFAMGESKPRPSLDEIVAASKRDSIDYIIFDREYIDYFQLKQKDLADTNLYHTLVNTDELLLLKL